MSNACVAPVGVACIDSSDRPSGFPPTRSNTSKRPLIMTDALRYQLQYTRHSQSEKYLYVGESRELRHSQLSQGPPLTPGIVVRGGDKSLEVERARRARETLYIYIYISVPRPRVVSRLRARCVRTPPDRVIRSIILFLRVLPRRLVVRALRLCRSEPRLTKRHGFHI